MYGWRICDWPAGDRWLCSAARAFIAYGHGFARLFRLPLLHWKAMSNGSAVCQSSTFVAVTVVSVGGGQTQSVYVLAGPALKWLLKLKILTLGSPANWLVFTPWRIWLSWSIFA